MGAVAALDREPKPSADALAPTPQDAGPTAAPAEERTSEPTRRVEALHGSLGNAAVVRAARSGALDRENPQLAPAPESAEPPAREPVVIGRPYVPPAETPDPGPPANEPIEEPSTATPATPEKKEPARKAAVKPSPGPDKPATKKTAAKKTAAKKTAAEKSPEGGGRDDKKKPVIDKSNPNALLRSLGSVRPSDGKEAMAMAKAAAGEIAKKDKAALARSLPEIPRPSGLPRLGARKKEARPIIEGKVPEPERPGEKKGKEPKSEHEVARTPVPGSDIDTRVDEPKKADRGSWWSWLINRVRSFLAQLPTRDPGVKTSAGRRPRVDLSGDADPAQNTANAKKSKAAVGAKKTEADAATRADFGENDIYPDVPEETLRSSHQVAPALVPKGAGGKRPPFPADARAGFDATASPHLRKHADKQAGKEADARAERDSKSAAERARGKREIAAATEQARKNQQGMQSAARADVARRREQWRKENDEVQKTFENKSEKKRKEVDRKIGDKVKKTNKRADDELSKAERRAAAERRKAERKAAAEKRKQKRKKRGFWSRLGGAIKSAFNAIKKAVNAIFNALRKLVKAIIEAAKKLVKAIIELARKVIVGLIKAFGAFLKGLVTIALAAFPKLAKKARAWIDDKVDGAVKAVNKAAEWLKKKADQILDAIGKALDAILAAYQKLINTLLDVLQKLILLILEIMEKIGWLISAARRMPGQFWGQMQEELLGMDLSKPLPFEKSGPDAAAQPPAPTSTTPLSMPEGVEAPALGPSDITVDSVGLLELEPEVLAEIEAGGGEVEFGENPDPSINVKSMMAAMALGAPRTAAGPESPVAPGPAEAPVEESVEEKLQRLIDKEPEGGCTKEKKGEPASGGAVPEHMKFGPLTPGQRGRYLFAQMKKGIKQWFSCNWPYLLAGLIAAILGVILANILTGGAIMAALPIVLQIIGAIMIGVAMVRLASYLGDYLKKGWAGEILGAAKALARALAIGAIELVFALIFNLGAVIKAARTVLKEGAKAGVKAGARATRAAVTTTLKNVKSLGTIAKQGGKAALRNTKLVFTGIKGSVGRGARSLKELGKRLWAKVRFRKFRIRRSGKWFVLEGYINPWVELAGGQIEWHEPGAIPAGAKLASKKTIAKYFDDIAKSGNKIDDVFRKDVETLTKDLRNALDAGTFKGALKKQLEKDIKKLLERFDPHNVESNPVLREAWKRALKRLRNRKAYKKLYTRTGTLRKGLSKSKTDELYKELYKDARGEINKALATLADDTTDQFRSLTNLVRRLPQKVEIHHLLYKSRFPRLSVDGRNLLLALRKAGRGAPDELHDLMHLLSSGGKNRWKNLLPEVVDVIKHYYGL